MLRTLSTIALIFLVFTSQALARTKLAMLPEREAVAVRFDNPAATLVEEERVLTLLPGDNMVDFSWRGVMVDPDSIRIAMLDKPDKVKLLSVSFPPGEQALLWRITSDGAREEKVRISYLLSGMDRLVEYRGIASKDEKTMDLSAYLILRNFSGEDYSRAEFNLGQGKPFSGSTQHEETRKILFLDVQKVPVKKKFTWDAAEKPWEPKRENVTVGIPVDYEIENSTTSGLGKDLLWNGKIRVYQEDSKGGTIFLGEDNGDLTPVGGKMTIRLGESREVAVTQKKPVDLMTNPRPSRQQVVLYDTEETITAEVENFKNEKVTVDLVEHIQGEWKMAANSMAYEKKDSGTIVFHVPVEPKGKTSLTFTYNRLNVRR